MYEIIVKGPKGPVRTTLCHEISALLGIGADRADYFGDISDDDYQEHLFELKDAAIELLVADP